MKNKSICYSEFVKYHQETSATKAAEDTNSMLRDRPMSVASFLELAFGKYERKVEKALAETERKIIAEATTTQAYCMAELKALKSCILSSLEDVGEYDTTTQDLPQSEERKQTKRPMDDDEVFPSLKKSRTSPQSHTSNIGKTRDENIGRLGETGTHQSKDAIGDEQDNGSEDGLAPPESSNSEDDSDDSYTTPPTPSPAPRRFYMASSRGTVENQSPEATDEEIRLWE
ncbi:hypothetical protein BDZ91DRAFT_491787 [Kalaharituber pfeilii]|nr:hypothetical protein BDZ91DRAFT_491787 [Kalaharituber pfeilii]